MHVRSGKGGFLATLWTEMGALFVFRVGGGCLRFREQSDCPVIRREMMEIAGGVLWAGEKIDLLFLRCSGCARINLF